MDDTNAIDLPRDVIDMVRARAPPADVLAAFVAAKKTIGKTYRELKLLCKAVKFKNLGLLEFLLAKGFAVNAEEGYMRPLPIHHAVELGYAAALEMLLKYGAYVNRKCYWDTPKPDSCFHTSTLRGLLTVDDDDVPYSDLLETRVDRSPFLAGTTYSLNARHSEGSTPLHMAVGNASVDVVRRLIAAGADVNIVDGEGRTPLHVLCARVPQDTSADLDIMRLLVDQPHCNVMAQTGDCRDTALETFVRHYLPGTRKSFSHSRHYGAYYCVEPMGPIKEMIQCLLQRTGELPAALLQHCIIAHMDAFEFSPNESGLGRNRYREAIVADIELWIHVLTLLLDRWRCSPDNSWESSRYCSFVECSLVVLTTKGHEIHFVDILHHCQSIFQTVIRYGTKEVRPYIFLQFLAHYEIRVCSTNATYFLDYFLNAHSASQQWAYLSRLTDAIDDTKFFEVTDVNAEQRLATVKQSLRTFLEQRQRDCLNLKYMCRQCVTSLTGRDDIKQLPIPDAIKDFLLCEEN